MLLVCLLGGAGGIASAAVPTPQDDALLALINQARQNPLAVAASMGMDPEKIVKDLPGLEKILREGLPALTFNEGLFNAACAHTQDMFARGYYSHQSPEGLGYNERIRNSGYPAAVTGESLGMLVFVNFIPPGDAVKRLFEYMFRDELDPARKERRNILNPGLKEAGAGVDTGVLRLAGVPRNVYLATVNFASDVGPEDELLRLINQARANPLAVAQSLGIDTAVYLAGRPGLAAAFERGLPPLVMNATLVSVSRAHAQDMLGKNYYGLVSQDGRTFRDRIRESGYRFDAAAELLSSTWLFAGPIDPFTAAGRIFERMLRHELDPYNAEGLTILNPGMKEAGIALAEGVFKRWDGEWGVWLVVCDVAIPSAAGSAGDR